MDIIFEIGLYLMPFENLFFAPSRGWATITPIIFFIYLLFNIKYVMKSIYKYKYIFMFFTSAIILSLINYIFVGIEIKNFINAGITLGLGIIDFISMDIYFRQKENKIDKCVKILLIVYAISLAVGWIQFITIKFNIEPIKQFFCIIEKRSYITGNRVQFTFTEPSFIGMHLFGILLPIYLYTKKKTILITIITFSISAIIFSSGLRILIDIAAVIGILYTIYFFKNMKNRKVLITTIVLVIIAILSLTILYNTNPRVKRILSKGIYADGSLASRFFRINACIKGTADDCKFLVGYGLGNSLIPIRSGYEEAMAEYKSSYTTEMKQIANLSYLDDSVTFCLYTRCIAEFGIIFLIIGITYLFELSRKSNNIFLKNYIWILFYIYLQFESYGFYTIWLYIVLLHLDIENNSKENIKMKCV